MPYRIAALLVCYLHFLKQETKDNLTYFLDNRLLDKALVRMLNRKLFPDWFEKALPLYDSQSGALYGLKKMIKDAFTGGLISYEYNTSGCAVKLAVGEQFCKRFLKRFGEELAEKNVQEVAGTLERLLLEEKARHEDFLREQAVSR